MANFTLDENTAVLWSESNVKGNSTKPVRSIVAIL